MPFVSTVPTSRIPDVYYLPVAPPRRVGALSTDIVGIVGEASRGPLDIPLYVGSPSDMRAKFGPMTDRSDLAGTPLSLYPSYLGVAQQGVQDVICVRVAGALCASVYRGLPDTGAGVVAVLHGATPGTWAQSLSALVTASNVTGLFDLVITNNATGERDVITGLDPTNNAALLAKINANAQLVVASAPVVDAPGGATFAPVVAASGTLALGTYRLVITWTTANGETTASPEYTVTTAGGNKTINVPWVADSGAHATGYKVYMTAVGGASGTEVFAASGTSGSPISIAAPPAASTIQPPARNTATWGAGSTTALLPGTYPFPTANATGAAAGHNGNPAANARYLGSAGTPVTGLYTLATLDPRPSYVLLAEAAGADTTQWAAQAQAAADYDWIACVCYPQGTSDAVALTTKGAQASLSSGANGARIKDAWPWAQFYDAVLYNKVITVAPHSILAGISAVQRPNTSAANKPVGGYAGPEIALPRSVAGAGGIEALVAANINVLSTTIPSRGVGFVIDNMFSSDEGFVTRMQVLLAEGFMARAAQYLEQPNTPGLRAQAALDMRTFLDGLAAAELIPSNPSGAGAGVSSPLDTTTRRSGGAAGVQPSTQNTTGAPLAYAVVCDDSNNVVGGVANKILTIDVQVVLFPNASQVLFRVQAGTTVQVTLQPSTP
jgi:uncharacterized protein